MVFLRKWQLVQYPGEESKEKHFGEFLIEAKRSGLLSVLHVKMILSYVAERDTSNLCVSESASIHGMIVPPCAQHWLNILGGKGRKCLISPHKILLKRNGLHGSKTGCVDWQIRAP